MPLVKVQVRRDTSTNWASTNPVLSSGEPGLETDTGKVKYGDGVRNWATLPYSSGVALGSSAPPDTGASSAGTSSLAARADHSHAIPANLSVQALAASGNAAVGGSLTVAGQLLGGTHRHSVSDINDLSAAVFAQITASIKAGSNVVATVDSVAQTITINSTAGGTTPLSIASDPRDVASTDGTAVFTARALGGSGAIAYQWQSSLDGSTWLDISGATGSTLSLSGLSAAADGSRYRLKATSGTESVVTLPALLRLPAVTIVSQPPDITVSIGQTVRLAVTATAGISTVAYQWQRRSSVTVEWEDVPNATSAEYSFVAAYITTGTLYRAAASAFGLTQYSRTATVVITGQGVTFSVNPTDTQDASGAASFSAEAVGGVSPLTLRWQRLNGVSATWADTDAFADIADGTSGTSGLTTTTLSLTSQTSAQHLRRYRLKATDANGFIATSVAATLRTLSLAITGHPQNVFAASGDTIGATAFAASGTADGGVTYQWQTSSNAGTTWANVSGKTAASYGTLVVAYADDGKLFRCGITGDGQTLYTSSAALAVSSTAVTVATHPGDAVSSAGTASYGVTYSGGVSGDAIVYWQWRPSSSGADGWVTIPGTSTTSSTNPRVVTLSGLTSAQNEYRVRAVVSKGSATVFSNGAALAVPYVTFARHPAALTNDTGVILMSAVVVSSGCSSPTFSWERQQVGEGSYTVVSGQTTAILSFTSAATAPYTASFRAVAVCGNATTYSTPAQYTKLVPPLRIATQPLDVSTSSTAAAFPFTHAGGSGGTATIKWERQVAGLTGSTWTTVEGATQLSLVLTGLTTQLSGSQYRATVTVGSESVTTRSATLTISGATITLNPSPATAVNGIASFSMDFSSTNCASPEIQWERRPPDGTAWGPVAGAYGKLLSLTALTASNSGWLYRGSVNCSDTIVYTSEALLTVPTYEYFLSHPVSQNALSGQSITLTYQGLFTANAYPTRWQFRRVGTTVWTYWPKAEREVQQSIAVPADAALYHNTEWRVEVTLPSDIVYSRIALVTVNKVTSIKTVNVSGSSDLIGIAFAKGAHIALSSDQTGLARRSTDGGSTWRYSYLPFSRYWDGIVASSQGTLVAYSSGDSGSYNPNQWRGVWSWVNVDRPEAAAIARSLDGGLTWSSATTPFFIGSGLRMWSFPYSNLIVATYKDDSLTSLGSAASVSQEAGGPFTRYGAHMIAFNSNNGEPNSWARYRMPTFATPGGAAIKYSGSPLTWDTECPAVTSVAISPAGVMVMTSRYQGFTYNSSGVVTAAYDRAGYMLYRNLAGGLGAPVAVDTATSGVARASSLRTITRSIAQPWRPR